MRRLARNETLARIGRRIGHLDTTARLPLAADVATTRAPQCPQDGRVAFAGAAADLHAAPALSHENKHRLTPSLRSEPLPLPGGEDGRQVCPGDSVSSSPQEPARLGPGAGAYTAPPGACHGPDIEAGGAVVLSDEYASFAAVRHESCDDGDLHDLPAFPRLAPNRFGGRRG